MVYLAKKRSDSNKVRELRPRTNGPKSARAPSEMTWPPLEYSGMKLIPWKDIWASLTVARMRGNGDMIEVFYDTLFKDAIFDDHGAWSLDLRKRN